jgi:hypothetical protein
MVRGRGATKALKLVGVAILVVVVLDFSRTFVNSLLSDSGGTPEGSCVRPSRRLGDGPDDGVKLAVRMGSRELPQVREARACDLGVSRHHR